MNEWSEYPKLASGLLQFRLVNCNVDNIFLNRTLYWLLNSSRNVLVFDFKHKNLTSIPNVLLASFKYLQHIYLDFNPINTTLRKGSFPSLKYLQTFSLDSCSILAIEPESFQGIILFLYMLVHLKNFRMLYYLKQIFQTCFPHLQITYCVITP